MTICRHFGVCGGCSLQDLTPDAYRASKHDAVAAALKHAGVTAEVLEPVIVPPGTRRRAVFKWNKASARSGKTDRANTSSVIGFHAARSHSIVDMRECMVLTPGLFDLAQQLRERLSFLNQPAEIHAIESLTGFDLAFRSSQKISPSLTAEMAKALAGLNIARVIFNNNLMLEVAAPEVEEGGVRVKLPPHAFLQSTSEGERFLQTRVLQIVGRAKRVADLFAGCGTFALPLARMAQVHAVEQDAPALAALAAAAKSPGLRPVSTEARDLFKLPLTPAELNSHAAVVLDPPRAGAQAQARMLARSRVPVIAYVSCDAASFARDATLLIAGGFRIGPVTPIDQFLWSSHIELVGSFERP